jgi:hypothetical protein
MSQPTAAKLIVAANGGSDLIYVPDRDRRLVRDLVGFLVGQPGSPPFPAGARRPSRRPHRPAGCPDPGPPGSVAFRTFYEPALADHGMESQSIDTTYSLTAPVIPAT